MHWGFASIPAVYCLGFVPVVVRGGAIFHHNSQLMPELPGETAISRAARVHGAANIQPRQAVESLRGNIPEESFQFLQRCDGAAANASEGFPLFGMSIISAHVARVPKGTIAGFAGVYLASRTLYTGLYLIQDSAQLAAARTTAWTVGTTSCLALVGLAAVAAA